MNSDLWLRNLYDTYYNMLYRIAALILQASLGHTTDVQDVLQDVFLIAAQTDGLTTHPNIKAWLCQTTKHLCMNYVRGNRRRSMRNHRYATEVYSSVANPASAGHAEASVTRLSIVQTLTEEDWELLRRYTLEEMTVERLAEETRISVNALRVKIFRIRKILKENQIDV